MPGLELFAAPLRSAPQQVVCLVAGAALFTLGRTLRRRNARRLWLACGFLYMLAAAATLKRPASESGRPTASELEAALGVSFVGASLACEKLERLREY